MKKYFLITAAVLISAAFFPAFRPGDEKEWVMKQYYFVLLSKGANRTQDSTTAAKLQAGHMANIEQMEKTASFVWPDLLQITGTGAACLYWM